MVATMKVDWPAQAAYLKLNDNDVSSTREVTMGVLVDLDAFDQVVGVELIELDIEVPVDEIVRQFHVRSNDLKPLTQVKTLQFRAQESGGKTTKVRPSTFELA